MSALSTAWRDAERKLWLARVAPEVLETADSGEIDLSTGSPPFPVPVLVKDAMQARIREIAHLEYPPTAGEGAVHQTIAAFDRRHLQAPYGPDRIVITYGAMQALSDVIGVVAGPGDEVLLPAPYWFQFPHIVRLNGAVPRDIRTYPGNHFKLTPKLLAEAITPRSRLLVLTSPNNPSGFAYDRAELEALMEVVRLVPGLFVASDEVYNLLVPGTSPLRAAPSACSIPDVADGVFVINSLSKNFAMSGLQAGARAALEAAAEIVGGIRTALEGRREAATRLLGAVPRLVFATREWAYYFWVDVSGWFGYRYRDPEGAEKIIRDDKDLVTYLKLVIPGMPAGVAVVNGTDCGMPGYVRVTYAVPEPVFAEGVARIRRRLDALREA